MFYGYYCFFHNRVSKFKLLSAIFTNNYMNVTYLCLGGNIGDRESAIYQALFEISQRVGEITAQSKVYETEAWGVENQVDYFAISFVQNAKDMRKARNLLNGYKGKLIAKIEKFDAVENIDEIVESNCIFPVCFEPDLTA